MRVPLLFSGPGVTQQQERTTAFAYVTDLAPSILELAGVTPPGDYFGGKKIEPMSGASLVPLLAGATERIHPADKAIGYELGGNAALFQGDYKIVLNREWPGDGQWHLYNIVKDPGEANDLSTAMPELFAQMKKLYQQYAEDNGVLPVADSYSQVSQVAINGLRDRYGLQLIWLIVWGLTLLPFFFFYRYKRAQH